MKQRLLLSLLLFTALACAALLFGAYAEVKREAIETEAQRAALRDMHCDLGQGYLCSRPMLLADVPQAIRLGVCAQAV